MRARPLVLRWRADAVRCRLLQPALRLRHVMDCVRCPEHSTTSAGVHKLDECSCNPGFVTVRHPRDASNREVEWSCACAAGTGIVAVGGAEVCEFCSHGTYKSAPGNEKCLDCHTDRTTLGLGSTSKDECLCKAGLYEASEVSNASDTTCNPCPSPGSECAVAGVSIGQLPLAPGYWRASKATDVLHACYNPLFCPNSNGSTCAAGHQGVFCEVCQAGYHRPAIGQCAPCGDSSGSVLVMLTVVLAVIGCPLICCVYRRHVRRRRAKRDAMKALNATLRCLPAATPVGSDCASMKGLRRMSRQS